MNVSVGTRIAAALGLVVILALTSISCKEDSTTAPVPEPINTGSASFERFVSIGNSLTAGYQSNALSGRDQAFSMGKLLADHLGVAYEQPLMKEPGIGARKRLLSLTGPVIVDEASANPLDPATNLNGGLTRPYNNLGIPGSVLFDMADTTDFTTKSLQRLNPFFIQILRSAALGNSIINQARALNPTFMTVWIGGNDVLGYATSGGLVGSGGPGTGPTSPAVFDVLYRSMLDALRTSGADIVVANIPDVTSIPFFLTVPSQGLVLRQGQADTLNLLTGGQYAFVAGVNGFVAQTTTGTRKLTPAEFVLLTVPQDSLKLANWGSLKPIPSQYVLDANEIATAQNAVTAYNASIDSLCANRNISVVDMNGYLANIRQNGVYVPGYGSYTASFITGGMFSYDGVHPSSRGNVLLTNEWIKVINAKFGASIPPVALSAAPGIPIGKVAGAEEGIVPRIGSLEEYLRLLTPWH